MPRNSDEYDVSNPLRKALITSRHTGATFNGMNVYVPDYCPLCNRDRNEDNTGNGSGKCDCSCCKDDIPASRIITDPERRFVPDTLLEKIREIIDSYMHISIYDTNRNGIVDLSEDSLNAQSVEWDNIKNKPGITHITWEEVYGSVHKHLNKIALDKIGIDPATDEPTWDDSEWPYPQTAPQNPIDRKFMRNIIISPFLPPNMNDGDFWVEVEISVNRIRGFHFKKSDNEFYSLTINDLINIITAKVLEKISNGETSLSPAFKSNIIGNGINNTFTIIHNLQSRDVIVQVYHLNTGETIQVHTTRIDLETIKIDFHNPPESGATFTVLIQRV